LLGDTSKRLGSAVQPLAWDAASALVVGRQRPEVKLELPRVETLLSVT
jgi:hypothetical protein